MSGVINRPMSQMRKMEAKESLFRTRKRILRYLVHNYLKAEGLFHAADTMAEEAGLTAEYEVCDNIDLDIIMQDYTSYYLSRFNKQPQFLRQVSPPAPRRPPTRQARPRAEPEALTGFEASLPDITVSQLGLAKQSYEGIPAIELKSLSPFLARASTEKKQLVEDLYQDIIRPANVSWEDIKGLEDAKSLLMESVVYPVRHPEVFTGLLEPWRGVLLHGPPGTGKTLLARAVANESRCTFFNVQPSTVVTKWRGDSERIVKVLFELASYYSPSIIFIDEVETLASERSMPGEHEASRRLKAQLLTELDGVSEREGIVFLLANSNMPWDIDPAMLRRLEKRIYIPLPDHKTRAELFSLFLGPDAAPYLTDLATRTEGYSGSDVKLVCKEALMAGVRKMLPNMGKGDKNQRKDRLDLAAILTAIDKTKPVSKNLSKRHEQWQNETGCS
ncbi:katanin p60 ATPase-containing subunit A-like 2 [Leguminivora glycinivorella]|uniref:katanin p60 ATPase-containing subunit A-like 2 n=1 Tax=Leguminivora glycinivorella TaxID=1035111 RepID=UPI00200C4A5A|nr:katanin p60 ATPase-containing subunit A-like 2 [Leguminivora glycinivorella]